MEVEGRPKRKANANAGDAGMDVDVDDEETWRQRKPQRCWTLPTAPELVDAGWKGGPHFAMKLVLLAQEILSKRDETSVSWEVGGTPDVTWDASRWVILLRHYHMLAIVPRYAGGRSLLQM